MNMVNESRLPPHSGKQHLYITNWKKLLKIVSLGPNNVKRGYWGPVGKVQQNKMPCTKPLVRTVIKHEERIISLNTFLTRIGENFEYKANEQEQKWKEIRLKKLLKEENAQLIPCGHCAGCKLTKRSSWANRMEMELPYHENAWFLTITYNDENIPYRGTWDTYTGELIIENYSLKYDDIQKFWKNLRRYIEYHKLGDSKKMMYYAAGEYGGETHRPHYHAIVYDLPIKKDDLKEYKRKQGAIYYNCKWIEKIWNKGYVVLSPATWNAMSYTAGYTTKKIYGKEGKEFYENLGITPEDCWMSTKPAIGAQYYYDHAAEIYDKDQIMLKNGKICKPPRYFDKLFDLEHSNSKPLNDAESKEIEDITQKAESEELKAIKRERRRIANDALFAQLKQTGLTMQEYYNLKDKKMQERMKKLIRKEI